MNIFEQYFQYLAGVFLSFCILYGGWGAARKFSHPWRELASSFFFALAWAGGSLMYGLGNHLSRESRDAWWLDWDFVGWIVVVAVTLLLWYEKRQKAYAKINNASIESTAD